MAELRSERETLIVSQSSDTEASLTLSEASVEAPPRGTAWYSLVTLRTLFRMFWPIYITVFFQGAMNFVSVTFVGHLGSLELAAVGLACSLTNITALGVGAGLATAADILGAQMYGARKYKSVGILLQRSFMILFLICFPIFAIWINMDLILICLRQPPPVARNTQLYLLIFIPGVLGLFTYRALRAYVQAQGLVQPPIYTCAASFTLLILLNYLFLYVAEMGIVGAALAAAIPYLCMPVLLWGYLFLSKVYRKTWPGFSSLSLMDWGPYLRIGSLTLFAVLLKISSGEIAIILMGVKGAAQQGAQVSLFQMETVLVMLPLSLGFTLNILIGQELGAGRPENAHRLAKLGLFIGLVFSCAFLLLIVLLRDLIGHIFTADAKVLGLISQSAPLMGVMMFFDGMSYLLDCIMRGLGRPIVSAVVSLIGSYVVGIPLGAVLAFRFNLDVMGMWIGLAVGFFLQVLLYFVVLLFWVDFQAESQQARRRVGAKPMRSKTYGTSSNGQKTNETSRNGADSKTIELTASKNGSQIREGSGGSQTDVRMSNGLSGSSESRKARLPRQLTGAVLCNRIALLLVAVVVLVVGIIVRRKVHIHSNMEGLYRPTD